MRGLPCTRSCRIGKSLRTAFTSNCLRGSCRSGNSEGEILAALTGVAVVAVGFESAPASSRKYKEETEFKAAVTSSSVGNIDTGDATGSAASNNGNDDSNEGSGCVN